MASWLERLSLSPQWTRARRARGGPTVASADEAAAKAAMAQIVSVCPPFRRWWGRALN